MRSVVTGGAGFIGSNLVDALLQEGDEVLVVDNFATGKRENLAGALASGARLEELDIIDSEGVKAALAKFKPEVIYHFAAQADVRVSMANPGFDARINIEGTVNLLQAAVEAGCERFIFPSSGGTVYGEGIDLPASEDHPLNPISAYAQSKISGELYCQFYQRVYGISPLVLRLGNVYGPRQDPHGEAGVVAIFCGRLAAGKRPTVFGNGLQTRDYIYVDDVSAAVITAGRSEIDGVLNVGSGEGISVLTLVECLKPYSKERFEPEFAPARAGEVQDIYLDVSKAEKKLGWTAVIDLREGLRRCLAGQRTSK